MRKLPALPPELTIQAVGDLRPTWLAWVGAAHGQAAFDVDGKAGFRVDGAAVDQIDAAGVQLLMSLAHALSHTKRRLQLVQASQPLAAACRMLGAEHLLADEHNTRAAA